MLYFIIYSFSFNLALGMYREGTNAFGKGTTNKSSRAVLDLRQKLYSRNEETKKIPEKRLIRN